MRAFICGLVLFLALFQVRSSYADLFVYESFDYASNLEIVQAGAGGFGFRRPWIVGGRNVSLSDWVVADSGLASQGLDTAGKSVNAPTSNGVRGAFRDTDQIFVGGTTTTSYLSFLVNWQDTSGLSNRFGGLYINGSAGQLFVGKGGSLDHWLIETLGGSGQFQSSAQVELNQTALLVVKLETLAGNDNVTLYVNPGQSEPLQGTLKQDLDIGNAAQIVMYHNGAMSIDEIRIGSNFSDVVPITAVPEPSSLLLVVMTVSTVPFLRTARSANANS